MDTYSTASSSSSSVHSSKYPQEGKDPKVSQSFHSMLHSVRKPQQVKPWKKPIAPLAPTPPRVYKVDPINFRDLVQKLTGAPDSSETHDQQQRLQRVAPPPLDLEKQPATFSKEFSAREPLQLLLSPVKTPFSKFYQDLMSDTLPDTKPSKIPESGMTSTSFEFNLLSPSSHGWCSFPLLSPGTLSSLEQSKVL